MGKSYTYNCIGCCAPKNGRERAYFAMNRLEMEQITKKAREQDGEIITYWYAQTKKGEQILGGRDTVYVGELKPARGIVTCEVCDGIGCYVCNDSGITHKGHYKNWADWQIEMFKKEVEEKRKT
jgi:hypothetical protein